ncbi:hypothetical protein KR059_000562, partial [Drosophila kikkawai]
GPGPGAYSLPSTFGPKNCDKRMQRSPVFSFGTSSRSCNTSVRKAEGPGPAAYHLGNVTRYGRPGQNDFSIFSPH